MHMPIFYISRKDPDTIENFDIDDLESYLSDEDSMPSDDSLVTASADYQTLVYHGVVKKEEVETALINQVNVAPLFKIDESYESDNFIKLDITRERVFDYLNSVIELKEKIIRIQKDQLSRGYLPRINDIDFKDFKEKLNGNYDLIYEYRRTTEPTDYDGMFGYIDDTDNEDSTSIMYYDTRYQLIDSLILEFDLHDDMDETSIYFLTQFAGDYHA